MSCKTKNTKFAIPEFSEKLVITPETVRAYKSLARAIIEQSFKDCDIDWLYTNWGDTVTSLAGLALPPKADLEIAVQAIAQCDRLSLYAPYFKDVLKAYLQGSPVKWIAQAFNLTLYTVNNIVREMLPFYLQHGLVKLPSDPSYSKDDMIDLRAVSTNFHQRPTIASEISDIYDDDEEIYEEYFDEDIY